MPHTPKSNSQSQPKTYDTHSYWLGLGRVTMLPLEDCAEQSARKALCGASVQSGRRPDMASKILGDAAMDDYLVAWPQILQCLHQHRACLADSSLQSSCATW